MVTEQSREKRIREWAHAIDYALAQFHKDMPTVPEEFITMERRNYTAVRVKLDLHGYDEMGSYWGVGKIGERLWRVSWDESHDDAWRSHTTETTALRAPSAEAALAMVSAEHEGGGS